MAKAKVKPAHQQADDHIEPFFALCRCIEIIVVEQFNALFLKVAQTERNKKKIAEKKILFVYLRLKIVVGRLVGLPCRLVC